MDIKNQITDFENYLIEEEKSMATIEKYLRDVRAFEVFLCGKEPTKSEIIAYKKSMPLQVSILC